MNGDQTVIDPFWIQFAQIVAVIAMMLAWFAYRKQHPTEHAMFRIDKVTFHDGNVVFYILRRFPFGIWRVFEPIPGVRSYRSEGETQRVLEDHLISMGIAMSETETVKEYGT